MPRKPIGDQAMTGAERLRRYRERVRKEQEATPDPSASPELIEARKEIARLRRRNKMLVEGLKEGVDIERVCRRLRISFKELEELGNGTASIRFAATAKIAKALHPDYKPTEAEREEAFKAFSQLKQSLDKGTTTPEPAAPRNRQRRATTPHRSPARSER